MNVFEHLRACMDYPSEVAIETTGHCNARCVFCPHQTLARRNLYMNDEMFLRIVDQLKEIPQTWRFYVSPFKVNDLLMDKQIFERIAIINRQLPNVYIRLFTNFNTATEGDIRRLCNVENIADIVISLNSLDSNEYTMLMGLDLRKSLNSIHKLLSYIRSNGIRMLADRIILSRVAQDADSDSKFIKTAYEEFEDDINLILPAIFPRDNWINHVPLESPRNQDNPCGRWSEINICCDGVVSFCCRDAKAEFPLGNIMEKTVVEIYNQPEYRRLREEIPNKRSVTPCRYCGEVSNIL